MDILFNVGDTIKFNYKGGRPVEIKVTLIAVRHIVGKLLYDYEGKNEYWSAGEQKGFNIGEMKNVKTVTTQKK